MGGCLKSILKKFLLGVALILAAYAGWIWGPAIFPRLQDLAGVGRPEVATGPGPSAELADSVLSRVQEFRLSEGDRMALDGREVTSVIRYAVPGLVPSGIQDPEVAFREGRVIIRAAVALSAFPELPDLGPVLGILPDTLQVELDATLMPFGQQESALLVHGVEASRIPIPRRLIPEILQAMGRVQRPGLPLEAMAVPLPPGLAAAYIIADSLILSSNP
jgi:hypothetical protein